MRSGTVYALAGALALSGCGGSGGGILRGAQDSPEPGYTQTVAPPQVEGTPTPSSSGKRAVFDGIVLRLPAGWRLGAVTSGTTCVLPPGQASCLGGALKIKQLRGGGDWPAGALDQPGGWLGDAPSVCYAPGAVDPDHSNVNSARISVRTTVRLADGRRAVYRQWEVPCVSGKTFTVKLWYVGGKRVVFYTHGANPAHGTAYDQIITGADLRRYQG